MSDRHDDPLSMDARDDLERVDSVMTRLLNDRELWDEFLHDPNGMFVRLGLHPPTSAEINARVNRIFFATLTNRELLKFLFDHYRNFLPARVDEYDAHYREGLKNGVIQNRIEYDFEGADHVLRQPEALREVLRLSLHDLNDRGLLRGQYGRRALDEYIEQAVEAIENRQPISDHPVLEEWDDNYGIGKPFGTAIVLEVGPVVTAVAAAEVGGVVTAVAATEVEVEVDSIAAPSLDGLLQGALLGDRESVFSVALLGRILDLAGELALHVHNFEREPGR